MQDFSLGLSEVLLKVNWNGILSTPCFSLKHHQRLKVGVIASEGLREGSKHLLKDICSSLLEVQVCFLLSPLVQISQYLKSIEALLASPQRFKCGLSVLAVFCWWTVQRRALCCRNSSNLACRAKPSWDLVISSSKQPALLKSWLGTTEY